MKINESEQKTYATLVEIARESEKILHEEIYPKLGVKCDPAKQFEEACDHLKLDKILDEEMIERLKEYHTFMQRFLHENARLETIKGSSKGKSSADKEKLTLYNKFLKELLVKVEKSRH